MLTRARRDAALTTGSVPARRLIFGSATTTSADAAGDRLLRACALAWKSHLRPSDTLARCGGEEFTVLLPTCLLADATSVPERLRRATPSGATAFVGVAGRLVGESASEVLVRADTALYDARHTGRDRLRAA